MAVAMWKDRNQDFTAIVKGANNPRQDVAWSVTGNTSEETMFRDNILHTGADENAESFTVTATSILDPGKSGASTVNIVYPEVTGVSIIEQDAAMYRGESMEFHATVEGLRGPAQDVIWSVEGDLSEGTKFDGNKLIVAKDEKNPSWTVRATSEMDEGFSATVTVKQAYKINRIPSNNGNIDAYYQGKPIYYAPAGGEITIEAAPTNPDRYKLKSLEYTDSKSNPIDKNTGTFFMPASDITVSVVFSELEEGDRGPGGGWIFYKNPTSTDSWKYLECAPTDAADTPVAWDPNTEKPLYMGSNLLSADVGKGKSNTDYIMQMQKTGKGNFPAAQQAKNYRSNGKDDWFLPTTAELKKIHLVLEANKEFRASFRQNNFYWSSTETRSSTSDPNRGKIVETTALPETGVSRPINKTKQLYVRAVRQF
jgi:hypothetical protein